MAQHTFDVAAFRAQFPQFTDANKYSDQLLGGYFTMAECYVSPWDNCYFSGDCLQLALNLMTAHLAVVMQPDATGQLPGIGIVSSTTIDKVTVTQQLPRTGSAWRAFLMRSPYGLQLVALLEGQAAGGWTVGGSLERQAYRKAGGVW